MMSSSKRAASRCGRVGPRDCETRRRPAGAAPRASLGRLGRQTRRRAWRSCHQRRRRRRSPRSDRADSRARATPSASCAERQRRRNVGTMIEKVGSDTAIGHIVAMCEISGAVSTTPGRAAVASTPSWPASATGAPTPWAASATAAGSSPRTGSRSSTSHTVILRSPTRPHDGPAERPDLHFGTLRERLLEDGHTFTSRGDTEVIAHLAEDHDAPSLARRLDGMFAFAVGTAAPSGYRSAAIASARAALLLGWAGHVRLRQRNQGGARPPRRSLRARRTRPVGLPHIRLRAHAVHLCCEGMQERAAGAHAVAASPAGSRGWTLLAAGASSRG